MILAPCSQSLPFVPNPAPPQPADPCKARKENFRSITLRLSASNAQSWSMKTDGRLKIHSPALIILLAKTSVVHLKSTVISNHFTCRRQDTSTLRFYMNISVFLFFGLHRLTAVGPATFLSRIHLTNQSRDPRFRSSMTLLFALLIQRQLHVCQSRCDRLKYDECLQSNQPVSLLDNRLRWVLVVRNQVWFWLHNLSFLQAIMSCDMRYKTQTCIYEGCMAGFYGWFDSAMVM